MSSQPDLHSRREEWRSPIHRCHPRIYSVGYPSLASRLQGEDDPGSALPLEECCVSFAMTGANRSRRYASVCPFEQPARDNLSLDFGRALEDI